MRSSLVIGHGRHLSIEFSNNPPAPGGDGRYHTPAPLPPDSVSQGN